MDKVTSREGHRTPRVYEFHGNRARAQFRMADFRIRGFQPVEERLGLNGVSRLRQVDHVLGWLYPFRRQILVGNLQERYRLAAQESPVIRAARETPGAQQIVAVLCGFGRGDTSPDVKL